MVEWRRREGPGPAAFYADLGHGLELAIWLEGIERLPSGAPKYNVSVFGRQLVNRSADVQSAQRRAENVARSWLRQAGQALLGAQVRRIARRRSNRE